MSAFSRMSMKSLFPTTLAEDPEYKSVVDRLFANLGGDVVIVAPEAGGLITGNSTQAFEVRDPVEYQESFRAFSALYAKEGVAERLLTTLGMKVSFAPGVYKVGDISVDRTTIGFDFSKMDPAAAAAMNALGI
jgi:hypothetical protein